MKRRNFFALLFAPLVARFLPKPKAVELDALNRVTFEYLGRMEGGTYIQEPFMYTVNNGINPGWDGTVTVTQYWWKDQSPFFVMQPFDAPWEHKKLGPDGLTESGIA